MHPLHHLLENNRVWSEKIRLSEPEFFKTLSRQQSPKYLWLGCADSRVPANEICGLLPGELFVHRNVANLVNQTDLNCLSVMQFAVEVLKVEHVIVCGHYGCGGVRAALHKKRLGLIDNWLRQLEATSKKYATHLGTIEDEPERVDRLCELNVIQQVINTAQTTVIQDAWNRGQAIAIHGWVYGLKDGLVRSLDISISNAEELAAAEEKNWEVETEVAKLDDPDSQVPAFEAR